jgi:hypothetical protein
VLGGLGRHQVEAVAHPLHRRGDVVQVALVVAGLVALQVEPEPVAQRRRR